MSSSTLGAWSASDSDDGASVSSSDDGDLPEKAACGSAFRNPATAEEWKIAEARLPA